MINSPSIYLNACSLGLPDPTCSEAVAHQALRTFGGLHEEAKLRHDARLASSRLLQTDANKVGLGTSTFQLWSAVMGRLPMRRGRILIAAHEWGDHVRWLQRFAAKSDVTIDTVPSDGGDVFDPHAWSARIDGDVIAICLPLVTSIEGLRYPAHEIANLPRPDDALIVLDVAQAIGRIPVEPEQLGCDVLVGTARKWLRGPRQTAMFWLSERARRVLKSDIDGIEPVDLNAALLAGLTQAIQLVEDCGLAKVTEDLEKRSTRLRDGLAGAPDLTLHPPSTAGTVTCSVQPQARQALEMRLLNAGLVVKWCNAKRDEPHSVSAWEAERLRLSPHIYNHDRDIDLAVKTLLQSS